MPSQHRPMSLPLTDEQHAALETIARRLNTSKTRLIIEALQAQHQEFAQAKDMLQRGKYPRKGVSDER